MRNTKQKEIIYEIILNSTTHPTAEEVYKISKQKIPNISLGTVYRNLNALVGVGKIKKIKSINGIDRYDNFKTLHCHFICQKCDKIEDIYDYPFVDDISFINGKVFDYDVSFIGICSDCLIEEENLWN